MGLIEKIETFINALLFKLFGLMAKLVPQKIKSSIQRRLDQWGQFKENLPSRFMAFVLNFAKTRTTLLVAYKNKIVSDSKNAIADLNTKYPGANKIKALIIVPFVFIKGWLEGLSATQAILLLLFTGGSILAVIGIGFSGRKLAHNHFGVSRNPASEEISYDRPDYYKKQTKHVQISNLRLPVYLAELNEVRAVDIDFIATMSNRQSKMFLEQHDFQFRDHLIIQMEPSIASFPLEEEGKEIIRKKLFQEINEFLILHNVVGEVKEIKITDVMAN